MARKSELKSKIQKYRKRLREMRGIVKVGLRTIAERDAKIAQLTSVLTMEDTARQKTKKNDTNGNGRALDWGRSGDVDRIAAQ
jgi:hypothetical protein